MRHGLEPLLKPLKVHAIDSKAVQARQAERAPAWKVEVQGFLEHINNPVELHVRFERNGHFTNTCLAGLQCPDAFCFHDP